VPETELIQKPNGADSTIAGVSIRAWLATALVVTICANHLAITIGTMIEAVSTRDFSRVGTFTTVGEPLYSMAVAALGFYFGQKASKP